MTDEQKRAHDRLTALLPVRSHFSAEDRERRHCLTISRAVLVRGKRYLSIRAAARALKKAPRLVRRMIRRGEAKYI